MGDFDCEFTFEQEEKLVLAMMQVFANPPRPKLSGVIRAVFSKANNAPWVDAAITLKGSQTGWLASLPDASCS